MSYGKNKIFGQKYRVFSKNLTAFCSSAVSFSRKALSFLTICRAILFDKLEINGIIRVTDA